MPVGDRPQPGQDLGFGRGGRQLEGILTENARGHRPVDQLAEVIDLVDLVLIMSVNPGFGGQAFIPSSLTKVANVREMIDASGREIRLEIDGGIKADNIADAAKAGADTFVAGSAIFSAGPDYAATISRMREALAAA